MVNKRGPKQEPCGTPQDVFFDTFSFYFQTYIASLTNKPHWLCHVNKPQELSAKVLSLNWGRFSGSQSIVFSPDGRHLCCGTKSETGRTYYLTVWDVETGKYHVWIVYQTREGVFY